MIDVDSLLFNISSFIAGLFLLEYGADKFIDNTAIVAKRLNVSPTLVGLLTCGAEWEELVVIIVSLSQKNQTLALGNLMGSSIANILASFSLGLLFMNTATFDRSSKIYAAVLLALTTIFVLLLFALNGTFKWISGSFLILAFIVYVGSVASLIYKGTLTAPEDDSDSDSDSDSDGSDSSDSDTDGSDSDSDDEKEDRNKRDDEESCRRSSSSTLTAKHSVDLELMPRSKKAKAKAKKTRTSTSSKKFRLNKPRQKQRPRPKSIMSILFRLFLGLGALLVSSYIIAHSAATLGGMMGLSGTVVGTTILSLATTLPEKFVAIIGGVRHQPGIMIANTVGSNIFLVTLCGGILFLWGDAGTLELGFSLVEASVMWVSAALILGIVLLGGKRWMGCVLLCLYVAFLVWEFSNGHKLDAD